MKREEAIKAIKTWDFLDKDEKEVLETLIPELAESKEEKIRNVIRGWLYTQPDSFFDNGISKEEMLTWLEKQGEQKEYTFKSLPRLLDMIEPTSKAKAYCQKLIDTLVKEGYSTDAKIVGECLKKMTKWKNSH